MSAGFNFENISLSSSADITKVMDNFNKIESDGITKEEATRPATTSQNGWMSSTDKNKLDGIEAQANKTVVDSSLSSSSTNPVQNKVINTALDTKVSKAGDTMTGPLTIGDRASGTSATRSLTTGQGNVASGDNSQCFGGSSISSGYASMASGEVCKASGTGAHAFGSARQPYFVEASGRRKLSFWICKSIWH